MIQLLLALIAAALFAGAALYINVAEHPARLGLDDRAALEQWKPSYARAVPLQAGLALAGAALGIWAWVAGGGASALIGAGLLVAVVAFTFAVIFPTNNRLKATTFADAGPQSRALLVKWGRLHAVRSALGVAATVAFAAALASTS